MLYKCVDCEETFEDDETETLETTYEHYYGLSKDLYSRTPLTLYTCPYCGSDCFEEYEEEEEEEEEV